MTSKFRFLAFIASVLLCVHATGEDEDGRLEIVSVTPSGIEVPISRGEVTIEFNKKMVAFGQTDKDLSDVDVDIKPTLECTWRWTSSTRLTCIHSDFLRPSTSYAVSVGTSIRAIDGSTLATRSDIGFKTASLMVRGGSFAWHSPTQPIFNVVFSQPMDLETILEKLHIRDLKTSELREIKVVHLAELPRMASFTSTFFVRGESGAWIHANASETQELLQSLEEGGIDRKKRGTEGLNFASRSWMVEPVAPLEPDTTYDLEVAPKVWSISAIDPTTRAMHISRFQVYPAFKLLGLECLDLEGLSRQYLLDASDANERRLSGCDPDDGITLIFTAPTERYGLESSVRFSPRHGSPPRFTRFGTYSRRGSAYRRESLAYITPSDSNNNGGLSASNVELNKVKIRYQLRGNTTYKLTVGHGPLYDVFDRRLLPPTEVEFDTGPLTPRFRHEPPWIVLSAKSRLDIPVYVANLRQLHVRFAAEKRSSGKWSVLDEKKEVDLPANRIVFTTVDFGNWLPAKTRRFVAAIKPIADPEHGENPPTSCIYGQVTPYDVQARIGHTSSIAWVTDLETGEVVPNATVSLVETKDSVGSILARTSTSKQGIASLPGRASFSAETRKRRFRTTSKPIKDAPCRTPFRSEHALWIDGPEGRSVLPLNSTFLTSGGYSSSSTGTYLSVWGHTAQGLYRPGQRVQYKIYVREQSDKGLKEVENRRFRLVVTKGYDKLIYHENAIELNEFGSFHGELTIPRTTFGFEGSLRFLVMIDNGEDISSLLNDERDWLDYSVDYWEAFKVEVLDFDPASIRVETSLNKTEYELGDKLIVQGRADLLSGAPFSKAPIKIDTFLRPSSFRSELPETQDYTFVSARDQREGWNHKEFQRVNALTDSAGRLNASQDLNVLDIQYGTLRLAIGVQEDSGNIIWESERAKYRSTDRFVGIRRNGERARVGEIVTVDAVVADPHGVPKNDRPVTVNYFRNVAQDSLDSEKWNLVKSCEMSEDLMPKSCALMPEHEGSYRAVATIKTADGREQAATVRIYVQGRANVGTRAQRDSVTIANAREMQSRLFQVGEFASLVVEHSVPGSSALVTVERLGILDQWVTELDGTHSVIDIPIRQDYAPIVRATITVTTANALQKPGPFVAASEQKRFPNSWRRSVQLRVKDPNRQLGVQISTDKETYEPGETVKVSVSVSRDSIQEASTASELAVAVVDQGVLEVSREGMRHFDPVRGLLESMSVAIESYWLLEDDVIVTGSRLPVGAPSDQLGQDPAPRSNRDFTSLWLPNLETARDGTASFEFKIGDRLTEWKIIVVAASPTEQFGLGSKSVATNLGIEVRPVLPNQVTDGDAFDASFSVLNRTKSERQVSVSIEIQGDAVPHSHSETITLEPYERRLVTARTQASLARDQNPSAGSIRFLASASSGKDLDALVQDVPVHPIKRFFVSSIYGTSTNSSVSEPIVFPEDITDGTGSLEIKVTPSLVSTVEERVAQVRDYPYQCWEQRLSSAIVAAQYSRLKEHMNVVWHDTREYIEEVLQSADNYQSSLGGFGFWNGESSHSDLYLSAYTALAFRWLLDSGYEVPEDVLWRLLEYLEEYTVYRLPDYLSLANSSVPSLRLMLANALVQHGKGDLDLVSQLYEENKNPNPFSISQTLEAAIALGAPDDLVGSLVSRLTNAVGVSGDRAVVHHGTFGRRNFMLSSTLKTTCSAISAFLRARNQGKALISEEKLAELVRGVLFGWNHHEYRSYPHESSFCLSALVQYAESFETVDDDFLMDVELVMDQQLSPPQFDQTSEMNATGRSFVFSTSLKPELVGVSGMLGLNQAGESRFYYKATMQYEPTELQSEPENFGIDISKAYWVRNEEDKWVELNETHELSRGDVVRVGLYLDIRDQRDFVIVDDPVPGFLQPINFRLAKTNIREVQPSNDDFSELIPSELSGRWRTLGSSRWGFYNREIGNENVRFASDFLPSGRYRLYWVGRVISAGSFLARPAHAEAMYTPEIYGNSRPQRIEARAD